MKCKQILSLILVLALLAGCANAPQPAEKPLEAEGSAQEGYQTFAVELLRQCREEGDNTLVSPLSVTLALGMTANGAAEETRKEFEALFHMDVDDLNSLCASFLETYEDLGGSTESTLVNSLWADDTMKLSDDFTRTCQDNYMAEVFSRNLQDAKTVEEINQWVSDATRGMIPNIVDAFSADTVLALINAIYLKNAFRDPFEMPSSDWTMEFFNADGTTGQPKGMVTAEREEEYIKTENGSGILLPYDDGRLGLLLMLPDEGTDITAYLAGWDADTIPSLLNSRETKRMITYCPKFETQWGQSLKEILAAMGLEDAFDGSCADFSAMGEKDLYIGDVIHKAAFELNEKGTEAAAATMVEMKEAAAMEAEEPFILRFERPFVYGIVDVETGTPLFLGTVEHLA